MKTDRLDNILTRRGWVTDAQVFQALMEQERRREPFGSTMVLMGYLTETQLAEALAIQYGTPVWDPQTAVVERAALDLFPERYVREKGILPLSFDPERRHLEVAVTDPTNDALLAEIKERANAETMVVATVPSVSLKRLWDRFYKPKPLGDSQPTQQIRTIPKSRAKKPAGDGAPGKLGLEFSFTVDRPIEAVSEAPSTTGVLLWLVQPFIGKLLRSLFEVERCRVADWDGEHLPEGKWDYVIYDNDNVAARPDALSALRRRFPKIQSVPRPSLTSAILRSPLSYERLRDGYVHFAEFTRRAGGEGSRDNRLSRYALATAHLLPLTPFEVDTLMVACEMAQLFDLDGTSEEQWQSLGIALRCPFPVLELYRTLHTRFESCEAKPGESTPESPLASRVLDAARAFLSRVGDKPLTSIQDLGVHTTWLHDESGKRFDPLVVEALLRVLREEVLEGCLPPGPAETILVADHPYEWNHLVLQLENEGWRTVIANGAAEARKLVERRKPDAIVWAAAGAIEWIQWQSQAIPGIANFLLLDEPNPALTRRALEAGYEDVWAGSLDAGVAAAKLRRAVSRRPADAAASGTVTGSLDQLSFIDLVQILTAGGRSVEINVTSGDRKAKVVLWQGQIKYAMAIGMEGEPAVYEVLAWEKGSFSLKPVDTMPPINCRAPNDAILLEGCRLLDERQRDKT
ncbi:MAG: DUF4388 domain-containing protein [Candidatus Zixiibacteriota bacterium]